MTAKSVYFIRPLGSSGPVKIGCSAMPNLRLLGIERSSPVRLEIAASVPGGFQEERRLHRRFAESRTHGEWFDYSDDLGAVIAFASQNGTLPPEPQINVRTDDFYYADVTVTRKTSASKVIDALGGRMPEP